MHADFPLKDIACMLLAQTKDAKIVCVIANNEDADPHTILNALLVLAMIEKNCTLTRMHASNKTVSEDEEEDDVFSQWSLYYVAPVVTSWAVAGQRMVFLHMYLQTRVTLSAFPIVTPRGCSSKFP